MYLAGAQCTRGRNGAGVWGNTLFRTIERSLEEGVETKSRCTLFNTNDGKGRQKMQL